MFNYLISLGDSLNKSILNAERWHNQNLKFPSYGAFFFWILFFYFFLRFFSLSWALNCLFIFRSFSWLFNLCCIFFYRLNCNFFFLFLLDSNLKLIAYRRFKINLTCLIFLLTLFFICFLYKRKKFYLVIFQKCSIHLCVFL